MSVSVGAWRKRGVGAAVRLICTMVLAVAYVPRVALADATLNALETGDQMRGFQAVGKLVLGGRGFCTGVLVAPDLVLTAAHCLFDRKTGARVPDDQLRFQAGWRNGRAEAYRGLRRAIVHPRYPSSGRADVSAVPHDLALLELDQAISLPHIRPFSVAARPEVGAKVSVVSYAFDRAEVPSIERDCQLIDLAAEPLVLTCNIDFGSSGAPVFAAQAEGLALVAVISAKADYDGHKVALGVDLDAPLAALRAEMALARAQTRGAQDVRVILGGQADRASGGSGLSGAKFLRP